MIRALFTGWLVAAPPEPLGPLGSAPLRLHAQRLGMQNPVVAAGDADLPHFPYVVSTGRSKACADANLGELVLDGYPASYGYPSVEANEAFFLGDGKRAFFERRVASGLRNASFFAAVDSPRGTAFADACRDADGLLRSVTASFRIHEAHYSVSDLVCVSELCANAFDLTSLPPFAYGIDNTWEETTCAWYGAMNPAVSDCEASLDLFAPAMNEAELHRATAAIAALCALLGWLFAGVGQAPATGAATAGGQAKAQTGRDRGWLASLRSPSGLPALDGVRSLGFLWVIALHTVTTVAGGGSRYRQEWVQQGVVAAAPPGELGAALHSLPVQIIYSGCLGVDVMFTLSGFLLAQQVLKSTQRSYAGFLWRRVARLWPSLAVAVAVQWWALPELYADCADTWWATLTFSSNWFAGMTTCLNQTWSVSLDMQLYALCVPLLWVMRRARNPLALPGAALLCCVLVRLLYVINGSSTWDNLQGPWYSMYFDTIMRSGPFVAGVAAGYLFVRRPEALHGGPGSDLACLATLGGLVVSGVFWVQGPLLAPPAPLALAIYAGGRVGFGVALAYAVGRMLTLSTTPRALWPWTWLSAALSGQPWTAIARLSWSAYLVQWSSIVPMAYHLNAVGAASVAGTVAVLLWTVANTATFALLMGVALYAVVERPLRP